MLSLEQRRDMQALRNVYTHHHLALVELRPCVGANMEQLSITCR